MLNCSKKNIYIYYNSMVCILNIFSVAAFFSLNEKYKYSMKDDWITERWKKNNFTTGRKIVFKNIKYGSSYFPEIFISIIEGTLI